MSLASAPHPIDDNRYLAELEAQQTHDRRPDGVPHLGSERTQIVTGPGDHPDTNGDSPVY
jgi:hypothetical protein